jgi:indolepyruvate decarboxylase
LDNAGYGTERFLHPGDWKYNDIHRWNYHKLPEVLGGGHGYFARTEGQFDTALEAAWKGTDGPSLIHVELTVDDASQTLRQLAARLGEKV